MASLSERYVASMVLSGVGDAVGFRNGRWEFCNSGETIHKELKTLGGIEKLMVSLPGWKVSDDTVMHLATAEALIEKSGSPDMEALYCSIAKHYKKCMYDMSGRSAGLTCKGALALQPEKAKGYQVPFEERGGGCGAAMRAMCIGLRYPSDADLDNLIAVSVESGRMTHHHPTGYLGALAGALFVTYSLRGKPVHEWGAGLMNVLPRALKYVVSQDRYVEENKNAWNYFEVHWKDYLKQRGILDGNSEPKFPDKYGVGDRDLFYKSLSYDGWGGASGHDAPMIAYDALLCAGDNWKKLVKHGMLHSGDSDSTGVIAAACFGAMYGFKGVPNKNYIHLEYRDRLSKCGEELYKLSHPGEEFCPAASNSEDESSVNEVKESDNGNQKTDTTEEQKNTTEEQNNSSKDNVMHKESESKDKDMHEESESKDKDMHEESESKDMDMHEESESKDKDMHEESESKDKDTAMAEGTTKCTESTPPEAKSNVKETPQS